MPVKHDIISESLPLNYNARDSSNLARHRWYFIKEAFSPKLVERAIVNSECEKGDLIIDPFCGSGTVPLVASLKEYQGIGIEVNPFLAFLTRTKLLQCDPKDLDDTLEVLTSNVRRGAASRLESFSTFSEAGGAKKWLFNREILRAFQGGWNASQEMKPPVRDLYQLSLIGAAMDTCNITRDGKALRYPKDWESREYKGEDFLNRFKLRLDSIRADMESCPITNNSRILAGDIRTRISKLKDKFMLCVTSPPYLNSFDYSDIYRPELFLGGFINSQTELQKLRLKTIRSHVQVKWRKPKANDFGQRYKDCLKLIRERDDLLWNQRIPLMIQAYFADMRSILKYLHNLAEPNARLCLIISTSAYVGIEVPVDLIIADIGEKVGWKPQQIKIVRYLRTSSQHGGRLKKASNSNSRLRESSITFKA